MPSEPYDPGPTFMQPEAQLISLLPEAVNDYIHDRLPDEALDYHTGMVEEWARSNGWRERNLRDAMRHEMMTHFD